jgi:hypothetical protein
VEFISVTENACHAEPSVAAAPLTDASPPPCFYGRVCGGRAALEKQGKSVCTTCAARLKGLAYPLRAPRRAPLYPSDRAAAEALDMVEAGHKKRRRGDPRNNTALEPLGWKQTGVNSLRPEGPKGNCD